MSNPQCSYDMNSSGSSGNERPSKNDMENVMYNLTLTYGTCTRFGSLYSFCIHVDGISYITGTANQIPDNRRRRSNHAI